LIKTIAGLMTPDEGHISFGNGNGDCIAYLPQAAELQRDFPLSVLQLVASGTWQKTGAFGSITKSMREDAMQALIDVGLGNCADRDLASLSSGQFQRVLFARLMVQDAPLILLDEPFTAIDEETTAHLLDVVLRWHKEGRTVICILHDMHQIRAHFPQCLIMARECVAWDKTATVINQDTLPYFRFFQERIGSATEICRQAS
jgi:zinc/manganese transport system ATP-binding protein